MGGFEPPVDSAPLPSVEQVVGKRKKKRNVNEEHRESLSTMERYALWITESVGTMGFFVLILVWTVVWMGWNYAAQRYHWPGVFDAPWQFAIWLFVSNLIQIHLMPLIMVGQNLQSRHAEARAEKEFEVTQQTEREMETVLRYLAAINRRLTEIDDRLRGLEDRAG